MDDVRAIQDLPVDERIVKIEQELTELQKRYLLTINISLEFPIYRELPEDVKLALAVLQKHKYVFQRNYIDQKGKINANV
jgi:hypothetical protein